MSVERASALHRQAAAVAAVAGRLLEGYPTIRTRHRQQHDLAARMRAAAADLAPGWLGASLDAMPAPTPLGDGPVPQFVRVGQAHPLDDASFPVVLPLLGAGHLAVDADARDPRVAGLLRSLVLRLLAATPAGSLRILAVDGTGTFAPFQGVEAVLPPAVADLTGLRAVLDEAEARVREPRHDDPHLLVVVGSLPELSEPADLVRVAALASVGPAARLHLIVAGWPPPPLTPESTQAPLALCTQITVRNPYTWVGDPPGASFGVAPRIGGRLNAPAYLDPDPPTELIRRLCAQLAPPPLPGGAPVAGGGSAWREYLTAAQRLDAVRQAPDDKVLAPARRELAVITQRLARQRPRLAVLQAHVEPGRADLTAARHTMADDPDAIRAALASARSALDQADAELAPAPVPEALRNAVLYGGYALLAVLAEIMVFLGFGLAVHSPLAVVPGVLAMPPLAFTLGWLTTSALAPPGASASRTPLLGAVISGLALVPALVLAALAVLR